MPEICRFNGIRITMDFADHAPPHIHAEYAGHNATYDLSGNSIGAQPLPKRQHTMVVRWISRRRDELHHAWLAASNYSNPGMIEP
ncbi:DUF4160 domain-containing protein [Bifidobacterium sp. UTBIF-78]|uniref:DUF4160 domain-containing protein n=1 Tax=Bifidobacterium sp. UTBIF-78 TaxID=1465263 RepID=UPI00112B7595